MADQPLSKRLLGAASSIYRDVAAPAADRISGLLAEGADRVFSAEREVPDHIFGDSAKHEELKKDMAAKITDHLCSVWGWLPDEEEAIILGEQLADSLFTAVRNTRTQPDSLLDALMAPRYSPLAHNEEGVLILREVK